MYKEYKQTPNEFIEGICTGAVDPDTGITIYQTLLDNGMNFFIPSIEKEILDFAKQHQVDIQKLKTHHIYTTTQPD